MPTEKNEALLPDPHVRHEGNTSAADDNTEQKTAHQKPVCRSNKNEKCFAETSAAIGTEPGQRRTRRNPRCRTTFKRKSRRNSAALMFNWCPGGDSNSHAIRRYHLKIVCLPIPPPGHSCFSIKKDGLWQAFFSVFPFFFTGPPFPAGRQPPLPAVSGGKQAPLRLSLPAERFRLAGRFLLSDDVFPKASSAFV